MRFIFAFLIFILTAVPVSAQVLIETFNRYHVEEVDGKRILYINSHFGPRFASNAMREIYEKKPDIIAIESHGGLINEMMYLANYIHRNHIPLIIEGTCLSACAYLLFFAPEVIIGENAVIGFHAPFTYGVPSDKTIEQLQKEFTVMQLRLANSLSEHGVPYSFTIYLLVRTSRELFAFITSPDGLDEIRDGKFFNLEVTEFNR
jgi:hypothetical protein